MKIGARRYYFNPFTRAREKGWKQVNGQQYYFGAKGYALTGLQRIGASRYYFNSKGVLQKNKLIRGKYYAGPRGRLVKGWAEINGKRYYFSKVNCAAVIGWRRIDGKVVHASNSSPYPRGGIKISDYDYTYIYGCARYWY